MSVIEEQNSLLVRLVKHFYRGSLNFQLNDEDIVTMNWEWQQKFLEATVNHNLVIKYPISSQFLKLFLKKLVEYLEEKQEVHDDIYSHLCKSMNHATDGFCHRHYLINYDEKEMITIKETNKMVVNGTTGMRTWEAALMLADWALCHRKVFTKKTILELGSGVGFTGITIGKLCQPKFICLTDCHPEVVKTISDNIKINFSQSKVKEDGSMTLYKHSDMVIGTMPLDWNSLEDIPTDFKPDVLIGADIVYDPVILEPLCQVLNRFFDINNKLEVYIASVIRNEDTFEAFMKSLAKMNFIHEKLSLVKSTYIDWDHTINNCLLRIKSKENYIDCFSSLT